MVEYKIVKPEKGVVGIMKGDKHIGYVENTTASCDVLRVIIQLQEDLHKAEDAIKNCIDWANGRESEWGDRAENSFEFLHNYQLNKLKLKEKL